MIDKYSSLRVKFTISYIKEGEKILTLGHIHIFQFKIQNWSLVALHFLYFQVYDTVCTDKMMIFLYHLSITRE